MRCSLRPMWWIGIDETNKLAHQTHIHRQSVIIQIEKSRQRNGENFVPYIQLICYVSCRLKMHVIRRKEEYVTEQREKSLRDFVVMVVVAFQICSASDDLRQSTAIYFVHIVKYRRKKKRIWNHPFEYICGSIFIILYDVKKADRQRGWTQREGKKGALHPKRIGKTEKKQAHTHTHAYEDTQNKTIWKKKRNIKSTYDIKWSAEIWNEWLCVYTLNVWQNIK